MSDYTYRKKPLVVEAWCNMPQFEGEKPDWLQIAEQEARVVPHHVAVGAKAVITTEGTMRADRGDWIIRGVHGELYPCKPDVFDDTYERAPNDVVPELEQERIARQDAFNRAREIELAGEAALTATEEAPPPSSEETPDEEEEESEDDEV